MSKEGDYIVSMGDIIVPNIVEIDIKKNLINANPRGIIDLELSGRNMMPASCVVRTKSNVEDYFRMNSPLVVLKKIGKSPLEITNALLTYGYLNKVDWLDKYPVYQSVASLIALGYLPVFLGIVKSFHTAASTSADAVSYEHIIAGQDLQTFMHNRFDFDQVNFEIGPNRNDTVLKNKYTQAMGIVGEVPDPPNKYITKGYIPRQKFINATVRYLLEKNEQYSTQFLKRDRVASIYGGITTGAVITKPTAQDITAMTLAKTFCYIKVPKSAEEQQEAIPINELQTHYANEVRHESTLMTLLPGLTPRYFYETFVREDTGEFVFRRASWYGNKTNNITDTFLPRQKFQNPSQPIPVPFASLTTYQKVYGGKMGELVGGKVHGQTVIEGLKFQLGPYNIEKFGTSVYWPTPGNGDWFPYQLESLNENGKFSNMITTREFLAHSYYDIKDPLEPIVYKGIDLDRNEAWWHAASWISKYNHSYSYVTWLGFSTYFPAPIGAAMTLPIVPGITQHLPAPIVSGLTTRNPSFTLQEESNLYRITGKSLNVSYRKDGSYTEEYNILLSNAGLGFRQDT